MTDAHQTGRFWNCPCSPCEHHVEVDKTCLGKLIFSYGEIAAAQKAIEMCWLVPATAASS
ncbi:MAG: hypothetical protein LAO30_00310 [Acidobacteriia bacterium]|nr:hypothetical protein [Terriglobia bacterium]